MKPAPARPAALLLALLAPPAQADGLFTEVDPSPRSQLWIDSGFLTAHFNRGKDLNGENHGLGAEYRFSGTMSAAAGRFYNSDRAWSSYAGVIWQPYSVGPLRIGAAIAGFSGYPHMRGGGWFPAAVPTITWEYRRFGLNLGVVPSYKDRLYGGISLQFKLRLAE